MDDRSPGSAAGGILTGMVLRLDPRLPVLWRTPSSVQVGTDPAVAVVEDVSDGDARLLAALVAGVSESGFGMLAASAGVADARREELLAHLAPALATTPTGSTGRAGVLGDSTLARAVAGLLSASGVLVAPEEAEVVVLVADWVLAPADHVPWLNRDVPHLPVVVSESAVTAGPLVEPGDGPCLHCVHLARVDADPAWPALATQLLGREPRKMPPLEVAEAAALVARRVLARLAGTRERGMSWRVDATGVSERVWGRHPECRCAAPPGTDWAAAPHPGTRVAPTTATAVGAPA